MKTSSKTMVLLVTTVVLGCGSASSESSPDTAGSNNSSVGGNTTGTNSAKGRGGSMSASAAGTTNGADDSSWGADDNGGTDDSAGGEGGSTGQEAAGGSNGTTAKGGSTGAGGSRGGQGGSSASNGGGSTNSAGLPNTGGSVNASVGGRSNTGGSSGRGGSQGRGGNASSAGNSSTAGNTGTGGTVGKGGNIGTGGASTAASGGSTGTAGQGTGGSAAGTCDPFSFFVTSYAAIQSLSGTEKGYGGNLGGLAGADEICRKIAESSLTCAGKKTWRAFLSTSTVNAIDRVGTGPWYDRLGRKVANQPSDLLTQRPTNADAVIASDLPNETGVPNHNPDGKGQVDNHDTLTGSNDQGKLYGATATCSDWTSTSATGKPRVGHSWPGGPSKHWMSAMDAPGCGAGVNLSESMGSGTCVGCAGGYGGFYCFAVTP